jgi:hypothetical protein
MDVTDLLLPDPLELSLTVGIGTDSGCTTPSRGDRKRGHDAAEPLFLRSCSRIQLNRPASPVHPPIGANPCALAAAGSSPAECAGESGAHLQWHWKGNRSTLQVRDGCFANGTAHNLSGCSLMTLCGLTGRMLGWLVPHLAKSLALARLSSSALCPLHRHPIGATFRHPC